MDGQYENGDEVLQQKVLSLGQQLEAANAELVVLRAAVAHLSTRLDSVENGGGGGGGRGVGGLTTPSKKSRVRPATAHPRSKPSSNGTVPKRKTKSRGGIPKVFMAREAESKEDLTIDPRRKGTYHMGGGKKINYVLPERLVEDEEALAAEKKGVAPSAQLQLHHVFGYNGKSARQNLYHNPANPAEVIYCIAAAGVVHDLKTNTQRFFLGHNEDIQALALHPTLPLVATGQQDPKGAGTPFICLWDSNSMELRTKITFHDRGISALAFTLDGQYLVSVGNDNDHELAMWKWESVKPKKGKNTPTLHIPVTSRDDVFGITAAPAEEAKGAQYSMVLVGKNCLKHFAVENLKHREKSKRTFKQRMITTMSTTKVTVKAWTTTCFLNNGSGEALVGGVSGHVVGVKGHVCSWATKQHTGTVGAIVETPDLEGYCTVGDDGLIKLMSYEHKETRSIDSLQSLVTGKQKIQVRSMSYAGGQLILGTKANGIIQVDINTGEVTTHVEGHTDEVWALAVHPTEPIVASGAEDRHLHIWNTSTLRPAEQATVKLGNKDKVRSADFSPDGQYLAAGTWGGEVALLRWPSLEVAWKKKVAGETVDALKFSPDSSQLAVGSWDQMAYVLSTEDGNPVHKFKGHTSSILMVQWSADGGQLCTNSRDYEALYWDTVAGARLKKTDEFANTEWATWNCFIGWPVQGIWEGAGDGTDINAVDRSPDKQLLAAGDDFGMVRLFHYPSMVGKAPMKEYPAHSSHVANVRFTADGQHLVSAGGADCGVFLWKVVEGS